MTELDLFLPLISENEDKSSPLKNRIRKNYRHLRKWAKRSLVDCFRIYDRDIKEYPIVIDFYAGRFCVQYFSFDRDKDEPPSDLKIETEEALISIFDAPLESIYWKTRVRRKKLEQYEKKGHEKEFFNVCEFGVKFQINLQDYLDTGLFLDHRELRRLVSTFAKNKRVLNLFAYTCSFSVHAYHAGASYTKSVDLSNTYTDWGRDNFLLNSFPLENNEIVRADCLKFLDEEIRSKNRYDLIIIDPPTLSRSKKMDQLFDIQKDYYDLISKGLKLLSTGGILFFSTNFRKFNFDPALFDNCSIREITAKTLPIDFRNQKIHRAWEIRLLN